MDAVLPTGVPHHPRLHRAGPHGLMERVQHWSSDSYRSGCCSWISHSHVCCIVYYVMKLQLIWQCIYLIHPIPEAENTKFFDLTLFGLHEVKLHHPMFLSPEILSFYVGSILATKLEVSGLKNMGRCKFTSCRQKRVNSKNFVCEK